MTELKCPFCQQELQEFYCYGVVVGYTCLNPNCKPVFRGNKELWQALIDTKKKLDMANAELDYIKEQIAKDKALEQINQKEK